MNITLIRTVLLYGLLILTVRLMGKRQVAEMEPAEFVVTMLLANLAAVPMQDNGLPLFSGVIPIFTILSLELILAVLSMKFIPLRKLLCGVPTLLIREGVVDQKALRASRVSVDELTQKLREKDIFDLAQVQFAILETDGELSVLPYARFRPPDAEQAGIPVPDSRLPFTLISDGVVLKDNLRRCGFDRARLRAALGGNRPRDVFLMTADRDGTVFCIPREKHAGPSAGAQPGQTMPDTDRRKEKT